MKRQAFVILAPLSLFVMVTATSAYAQSNTRYRANIPFEFSVRDKILPAGQYVVSQIVRDTLRICSVDGSAAQVVLTIPTQSSETRDESTLVFNRYRDQYFLATIWPSGKHTGRAIHHSRAERELIRELTALEKRAPEPQLVSIALVAGKR